MFNFIEVTFCIVLLNVRHSFTIKALMLGFYRDIFLHKEGEGGWISSNCIIFNLFIRP